MKPSGRLRLGKGTGLELRVRRLKESCLPLHFRCNWSRSYGIEESPDTLARANLVIDTESCVREAE